MLEWMMSQAPLTNAEKKESAARYSVFASAGIAVFKLIAGLMSGSLALLSEAGHALIDLGATIVTWFAVQSSEKPADDDHHYGHGKIEAVAALAETGLLFILAIYVAFEAIQRLISGGNPIEVGWWVIGILVASIIIDFNRWRHLTKIAKETNSIALAADALHFSSDLISSTLVLAGLGLVIAGFPKADSIAALAVAAFILIASWRLGKRTVDTLTDAAPEGASEAIRTALEGTVGIIDIETIRVRPAGATLFVEATVTVPRTLALDRVQAIKDRAVIAIQTALPNSAPVVTARPRIMDDESILVRVILIAAKRRIPVHHVTVQTIGDRLSIGLDVEVDARMSLGAAHQIATKLETAIRADLGPETEVETHIEPLEAQGLVGHDLDAEEVKKIGETLRELSVAIPHIGEVHNTRVRTTERGLVVTLHVRAEAHTSVAEVHAAVDQLEQAARRNYPDIARIVTHAEPKRMRDELLQ